MTLMLLGDGAPLAIARVPRGEARREHVLVEIVDRPEIAEVPIEIGAVLSRAPRDRGHDHVAAVAGIAGDGEAPRPVGGGGEGSEERREGESDSFHRRIS